MLHSLQAWELFCGEVLDLVLGEVTGNDTEPLALYSLGQVKPLCLEPINLELVGFDQLGNLLGLAHLYCDLVHVQLQLVCPGHLSGLVA